MTKITSATVKHMADLAKIPITVKEEEGLAKGFTQTLEVVDKLFNINVKGVKPMHQVTGLENIFREDEVNEKKTLTQNEALSNTKSKHNGYFIVDQILAED